QNKILNVQRDFSADELRRATNYLNDRFSGRSLSHVREVVLGQLTHTGESMNALMVEAIEMAHQVFPDSEPEPEFVMAGETNLMGLEELADVDRLQGFFAAVGRHTEHPHMPAH